MRMPGAPPQMPRPPMMGRPAGAPMGMDPRFAHAHKRKAGGRHGEDDDMGMGRLNVGKELAFFEKVKQRLRNKDAYQDFLKVLHMYSMEIITKPEMGILTHDLLHRFPDLLVSERAGAQHAHSTVTPCAHTGWLSTDRLHQRRSSCLAHKRLCGHARCPPRLAMGGLVASCTRRRLHLDPGADAQHGHAGHQPTPTEPCRSLLLACVLCLCCAARA